MDGAAWSSGVADKACYYTGLCVLRSANWPLMKVKFLLLITRKFT